ncbi:MAG: type II toxin-antitoxin system VapC family toxin [Candidatus Thorarchaeota archaeon]
MNPSHDLEIPSGLHYLDSCVLLNWIWITGNRIDSIAAKNYLKSLRDDNIEGVITAWCLMEIISVLRASFASIGNDDPVIIEHEVQAAVDKIFRLKGIRFVAFEPLEMADYGITVAPLWKILRDSLEHLKQYDYTVEYIGRISKHIIRGIGSADAVHVHLATSIGCDYLSTFDKGFWTDTQPLKIFDVRKRKVW